MFFFSHKKKYPSESPPQIQGHRILSNPVGNRLSTDVIHAITYIKFGCESNFVHRKCSLSELVVSSGIIRVVMVKRLLYTAEEAFLCHFPD